MVVHHSGNGVDTLRGKIYMCSSERTNSRERKGCGLHVLPQDERNAAMHARRHGTKIFFELAISLREGLCGEGTYDEFCIFFVAACHSTPRGEITEDGVWKLYGSSLGLT